MRFLYKKIHEPFLVQVLSERERLESNTVQVFRHDVK